MSRKHEQHRLAGRGPSAQHAAWRIALTFLTRNCWWIVPMLVTFAIFCVLVVVIGGEGLSLYLNDPT